MLKQFGELPAELEGIQKYAAWKAGDIRKALREGRQPTAPDAQPSAFSAQAVAHAEHAAEPSSERDFEFPAVPHLGNLAARHNSDLPSVPSSGALSELTLKSPNSSEP